MPLPISEIVIWPISLVNGSTVIYISSMVVKRDSVINEMINLKHPDTGHNMLASKSYSTMCPRCKLHNFTNCKHDVFMPTYFDPHRMLMTTLIMKRNKEAFQREIKNEFVEKDLKSPFDHAMITEMLDPRNHFREGGAEHTEVYVIVDPAAGGKTSRYAIVSIAVVQIAHSPDQYVSSCLVILGAENCEERQPKKQRAVLLEHLDTVRKIPGFSRCKFIVMPESNLALESSHIEESLQQALDPSEYYVVREDTDKPGFRTDMKLKEVGTNILSSVISYGQLKFHEKFFTCPMGSNLDKYMQDYKTSMDMPKAYFESARNDPGSRAREDILFIAKTQLKAEIVRQLHDWKEEVVLDKREIIAKRFYSGKYGGKPDDLCMCFVGGFTIIKKWRNTVRDAIESSNMQFKTPATMAFGLIPQKMKQMY